jgi:hypothetical protein
MSHDIGYVEGLLRRVKELEDENTSLKEGSCRFNCISMKKAFMAGWDAGSLDAFEGGEIIDPDLYLEVIGQAYKDWKKSL